MELARLNHYETGALVNEQFNPSREKYTLLEKSGCAVVFTARIKGVLVGYSVFIVSEHIHYPGRFFALQDLLYIKPAYRGIGSVRFINWTDGQLKELKIDVICRVVSKRGVDFTRTLERLGYQPLELSLMKIINPELVEIVNERRA